LGVFIRSDIYFRVAAAAREPDKIPVRFLTWTDEEVLLQVVEERFLAGRRDDSVADELWTRYFEPHTKGQPTRSYMASRVLPRPRDILYLANAAIESAVRHRHPKVTEADVLDAERQYSQFAFEALPVEGAADLPELESILFEFAGEDEVLTEAEVGAAVARAGPSIEIRKAAIVDQLVALSFLGRETRTDQFDYAENPRDKRRLDALANRFAATEGREPRYRIHPAYQAYLEVTRSDDSGQQALRLPA
jgi:hypothetical protein